MLACVRACLRTCMSGLHVGEVGTGGFLFAINGSYFGMFHVLYVHVCLRVSVHVYLTMVQALYCCFVPLYTSRQTQPVDSSKQFTELTQH